MGNPLLTITMLATLVLISCNENSQKANPEENKPEILKSQTENGANILIGSWVQPNPINNKEVQGFKLKEDESAESINMATLLYKKWWLKDGKLVLVAQSIGNHSSSIDTTKYEIVNNTDLILELKNGDYTDKYTRQ